MEDLGTHLLLFLFSAAVVVAVTCMFTEADDGRAVRMFPRRYATFVLVTGAIVGAMILVQSTVASVG